MIAKCTILNLIRKLNWFIMFFFKSKRSISINCFIVIKTWKTFIWLKARSYSKFWTTMEQYKVMISTICTFELMISSPWGVRTKLCCDIISSCRFPFSCFSSSMSSSASFWSSILRRLLIAYIDFLNIKI